MSPMLAASTGGGGPRDGITDLDNLLLQCGCAWKRSQPLGTAMFCTSCGTTLTRQSAASLAATVCRHCAMQPSDEMLAEADRRRLPVRRSVKPLGQGIRELMPLFMKIHGAAATGTATRSRRLACAQWILLEDLYSDEVREQDPPEEKREALFRNWWREKVEESSNQTPSRVLAMEAPPEGRRSLEARSLIQSAGEDTDQTVVLTRQWSEPDRKPPGAVQSVLTVALGLPVVVAFAVLGLWMSVGGIWHAFTKHGESVGVVSVIVPPLAWFYAIECFWHTDATITPGRKATRLESTGSPPRKVASWESISVFLASPDAEKAAAAWGYGSVEEMRAHYMEIKRLGFRPDPGGNGWVHPDGRRVDRNGVGWWPDGTHAGK